MQNRHHYHVASGCYYVGRQKPLILEAYLGTCVGVALFDEETGVGGLSHLLLPEPISLSSSFQPEKYASTGFPIFLRALYDEGASKKRLKAFIAGGALVGPLISSDLRLDIGGRTVEKVMSFLKEEDIPIEQSETGGFFTCCLSLDLTTWQCHIKPSDFEKDTADSETQTRLPSPREIEQTMEAIQPIPQVALKILRLIDEDEYDIKALTAEIRKDQVISAKTLKLCNSVIFAGSNKIESLDHALIYIGLQLLVKLVISASVDNFFSHLGSGYSLCKGGLFHHAIGTAVISEKLADLTGRVKPGSAYTAGLLHDIGKVVLDQYVSSAYPLFYRELNEEGKNFSATEKTILGIDHMEVGSELARRWSFPESLIDVIRHHHKPEDATRNLELVHIIYLADLLMSRFHTGLELERLDTATLAARLEVLGLSLERFPDIVDLIPLRVFESSPELALGQR
ncbi:MAG: HDOD domain-containing protein [Desulfobacterales bacterium]|nr:MAG: HDOD domain-containing protein [Desulfobacterales bacterium]